VKKKTTLDSTHPRERHDKKENSLQKDGTLEEEPGGAGKIKEKV